MIERILNNPRGEFFFSFLIGIGLAIMLFHRPIKSQKVLALEPAEFENKIVKANSKCFQYRVEDCACELT
jgi:hypothetical protein